MKTLLSIAFAAIIAVTVSASGAHADNAKGTCNSIVANALGAAQHCARLECFPEDLECDEVAGAFMRIFETEGCAAAVAPGELEGLPTNASIQPAGPNVGNAKHIQEVICNSIAQCGFCGAAAVLEVCGTQCF